MPWVKRLGSRVVALTGNPRSPLAQAADVHLDVGVRAEACPLGLAPTASTTAALAMGDALSMALLERRGFTVEDFAVLHPGGRLGKKLLRVEDLMHTGDDIPRVAPDTPMKDVLFEMTRKRLGLTTVTEEDGTLLGMISDGDLRRQMERHGYALLDRRAAECMTRSPVLVGRRELADTALDLLETPQDHLAARHRRERPRGGRPPPARPVEDGDDLAGGMSDTALLAVLLAAVAGLLAGGAWAAGRGGAGRSGQRPAFRSSPHYTEGLHCLATGQLEPAIHELDKVLRDHPDAVEVQQVAEPPLPRGRQGRAGDRDPPRACSRART